MGFHFSKRFAKKNLISLTPILLSTFSLSVQAGAWVPEQGQGYGKLGEQIYKADDFFGGSSDVHEFRGNNLSFYGELGLGNNNAIYGTILAQDIEQTDTAGNKVSSSGLGDVEVGIRHQWSSDPVVFATSFLVKLPYFYDEDEALPRGNGQLDYEVRALVGKSLYPYGYAGFELGYRVRTESPSDEIRYLLEYGYSFNDHLYFRTKLDGILSAENADSTGTASGNLSLTPEYDLTKWELTAGWNFDPSQNDKNKRWGVELTYTDEVSGDNTLKGDAIQLGITRVF